MSDEIIGMLLAAAVIFLLLSGVYFWVEGREVHYDRGYACATRFHEVTTEADSLKAIIDGCRLLTDDTQGGEG